MADPELVRTLDYILNRCDKNAVEAIAAAVIRRKRDLALFGASKISNPHSWAKKTSQLIGDNAGFGLASVKRMVREAAAGMLRREAPELGEERINELLTEWVDGAHQEGAKKNGSRQKAAKGKALDGSALALMVDQFVAYSRGELSETEDKRLREEMPDWPDRYWNSFTPALRDAISAFVKGKIDDTEYSQRVLAALESY